MKTIVVAMVSFATITHAEMTSLPVVPSATDPDIKTFNEPHWFYVNRDIVVEHKEGLPQDRHQLLLWLTGTGGKGHDAQGISNLAADLGYHVVTLMYPDNVPATACANDSNTRKLLRISVLPSCTAEAPSFKVAAGSFQSSRLKASGTGFSSCSTF